MAVEHAWLAVVRGDRRGPLARLARCGLRLLSAPYAAGVAVRNRLYDGGWLTPRRVPVPVVSVGNLNLGGTGKTPCVEFIARFYREQDVRVVVLSRGYGSDGGLNDEARVLEDNLPDVPHLQGADRAGLAAVAIEELEAELLVLDDGFQHRRLHRDWDIVLVDATRPPHRDALFPAGTLREPLAALRRADVIVLTRCDQVPPAELDATCDRLARLRPGLPIVATEHRPISLLTYTEAGEPHEVGPPGLLHDRPVFAFCGIGHPAAFYRTLESLGAQVQAFRAFPDHHPYSRDDVADLARWAAAAPADAWLVCTQKDGVKLRVGELGGRPLRVVRVGLAFRHGQDVFEAGLRSLLPSGHDPQPDQEEHGCAPST